MPSEGIPWKPHQEILSYEEITEVVSAGVKLGIRQVRLTGGEPLVRRELPALVRELKAIPGIEEISLTTNALLLEKMAQSLAEAGLQRVNISLDTLHPEKFSRITRGGVLDEVWRGILAAEQAGLQPIKVNAVVVKGMNDDELVDLARLTIEHAWQIRFIEFMPVGNAQDWGPGFPAAAERYLPVDQIRSRLSPLGLEEIPRPDGCGPAKIYQIPGAAGTIGMISPVGEHFCGVCNRLRLTADGHLRPCLLNNLEIPLRDALKRGEDLTPYFEQAIQSKPAGHTLFEKELDSSRKMAQIGG